MRQRLVPLIIVIVAFAGCGDSSAETQATTTVATATTVASRSDSGLPWWNDRVFYEVFVRSFKDSDGDGIGDFAGLTASLDYLNDGDPTTSDDLGVTGIWLMPIFPSPSYHGYDVTDYRTVNPDYGTMGEFDAFLEAAHARGIAVLIDLVINHSSSEHPWFVASAGGGSEYDDWYVWSDEDAGTTAPWGAPAWHEEDSRYYFGLFWEGMPDLNLENPVVTAELRDIARYWLEDVGVDGFRLDAARHLIEDGDLVSDTPATMSWLEDFNAYVDSIAPDALVLGEVWSPTVAVARYVPEALDLAFEFDLTAWRSKAMETQDVSVLERSLETVARAYPDLQYATFLTNHDMDRIMSTVGGDVRMAKLAAVFLLTGPGVPFVYYGEEVGLEGVKPDERIRTPMPWTAEGSGVGFTTGTPWQPPARGSDVANVATQTGDPDSLLSLYRSLIQDRATSPALRHGDLVQVATDSPTVLAYLRSEGNDHVLVILNMAPGYAIEPTLDLASGPLEGWAGVTPIVGPPASAPAINDSGGFGAYRPLRSIPPYGFLALRFTTEASPPPPPTTTTTSTTTTLAAASREDVAVIEALLAAIAAGDIDAARALFAPDAVVVESDESMIRLDEPIPPSAGIDETWDWDNNGIVTLGEIIGAQNAWGSAILTSFAYECAPDGDHVDCALTATDVFSDAAELQPETVVQAYRVRDGLIVEIGPEESSDAASNEAAWTEQFAAYEQWMAELHPDAYAVVFRGPCCTGIPDGLVFSKAAIELQRGLIPEWAAEQSTN